MENKITVFLHNGHIHHIRTLRGTPHCRDYYPGTYSFTRLRELLSTSRYHYTIEKAWEPYTLRTHYGSGW